MNSDDNYLNSFNCDNNNMKIEFYMTKIISH